MTNIITRLFGDAQIFGLNIGFWISMIIVAIIVITMNIVFWKMKPKRK